MFRENLQHQMHILEKKKVLKNQYLKIPVETREKVNQAKGSRKKTKKLPNSL